ncbi:cytochrome c [Dongia mobilis]|uniref:Cytochrome c n=1 Tax=Dongia mobilis TaxID=578943 RepID=A0A4R6WV39_9PROT|nr:cytochrome c family protein [Dongia mobilis]TDQ82942.1 cytochrome c [Dongia mobilis]
MRTAKLLPVLTAVCALTLALAQGAAAADPASGEKVFNKCKACHTLEAGKNKIGPSLQGIIGRTAGTVEGFKYSEAMKAAGTGGLVWNDETLDKYLENTKGFVPGNKMPFPGLKKPEERADVIAYIKSMMK